MSRGVQKNAWDLSWLAKITLLLGVAALLALTIGRAIAIIAMISIIGIPIFFLLAAIPAIFLLVFAALAIADVLGRAGVRSIPLAFALAAGAMALVPEVHNRLTREYAEELVSGDHTGIVEPWTGGTLAIFIPSTQAATCGDFCQRTLAAGTVKTFIVAHAPVNSPITDLTAKGTGFRLEQRGSCETVSRYQAYREYPIAENQPSATPAFRLFLAQGGCLVKEPAPVAAADGILSYRRIRDDYMSASLDPFKIRLGATRLSFFRRRSGKYDEVWRETSVRYETLYRLLIPTYIFSGGGGGLNLDVGLLRDTKTAGVLSKAPDVNAFVSDHLRMSLTLPEATFAAWQQAALDTILRELAAPEGADPARVEDFFEAFADQKAEIHLKLDTIESLLSAVVRNRRYVVPQHLPEFTAAAYRGDHETGKAVANAIMDRLDREISAVHDPPARTSRQNRSREKNLESLGRAVTLIPDEDFPRLWPRMRIISGDMMAAVQFAGAIRRASLAAHPTADMMALIDLQQEQQRASTYDRKKVFRAALAGLCAMGPAGADALPALEARLQTKGLLPDEPERQAQDWIAIAHTLAALGADLQWIRRLPLPVVRRLEPLMNQAMRKPDCTFR